MWLLQFRQTQKQVNFLIRSHSYINTYNIHQKEKLDSLELPSLSF